MRCKKLRIRSSFRFKIFIVLFAFTVVISVLIGTIVYTVSARLLKNQMQDTMRNNLINTSHGFDSLLGTVNDFATRLSLDSQVLDSVLVRASHDSYEYYTASYAMRKTLQQAIDGSTAKSFYILSSDGRIFYKNNMDRTYMPDEITDSGMSKLMQSTPENRWMLLKGNSLVEAEPEPTLSVLKCVRSMGKAKGYVMANIGAGQISGFFRGITFGQNSYVAVYTPDMHVLYIPGGVTERLINEQLTLWVDPLKRQNTIFLKNAMITYVVSEQSGFVYAAYVPMSEVVMPTIPVRNATVSILLLGFLVVLAYSVYISNWLFSPISTLVGYMERAGNGETGVQITECRHDELGILYTSFNRMISQINQLMNKLYLQEMLSRDLQLKNLQIQLNPHFLYNTLDAIHWAARENNTDEVCRMTVLLSRYFQTNLSNGQDFVTVREAAKMINSYIDIQKLRFFDRFRFVVEVDEAISDVRVLKYLFQPLVENAILHGLEKKSGAGLCRISFRLDEGYLRFTVEDDGVGIPPAKLAELRSALSQCQLRQVDNFALNNINLQLKLYYGANVSLQIKSEMNKGTRAGFLIPIREDDHV